MPTLAAPQPHPRESPPRAAAAAFERDDGAVKLASALRRDTEQLLEALKRSPSPAATRARSLPPPPTAALAPAAAASSLQSPDPPLRCLSPPRRTSPEAAMAVTAAQPLPYQPPPQREVAPSRPKAAAAPTTPTRAGRGADAAELRKKAAALDRRAAEVQRAERELSERSQRTKASLKEEAEAVEAAAAQCRWRTESLAARERSLRAETAAREKALQAREDEAEVLRSQLRTQQSAVREKERDLEKRERTVAKKTKQLQQRAMEQRGRESVRLEQERMLAEEAEAVRMAQTEDALRRLRTGEAALCERRADVRALEQTVLDLRARLVGEEEQLSRREKALRAKEDAVAARSGAVRAQLRQRRRADDESAERVRGEGDRVLAVQAEVKLETAEPLCRSSLEWEAAAGRAKVELAVSQSIASLLSKRLSVSERRARRAERRAAAAEAQLEGQAAEMAALRSDLAAALRVSAETGERVVRVAAEVDDALAAAEGAIERDAFELGCSVRSERERIGAVVDELVDAGSPDDRHNTDAHATLADLSATLEQAVQEVVARDVQVEELRADLSRHEQMRREAEEIALEWRDEAQRLSAQLVRLQSASQLRFGSGGAHTEPQPELERTVARSDGSAPPEPTVSDGSAAVLDDSAAVLDESAESPQAQNPDLVFSPPPCQAPSPPRPRLSASAGPPSPLPDGSGDDEPEWMRTTGTGDTDDPAAAALRAMMAHVQNLPPPRVDDDTASSSATAAKAHSERAAGAGRRRSVPSNESL